MSKRVNSWGDETRGGGIENGVIQCGWCGARKTYSGIDSNDKTAKAAWEDGWDSLAGICPACIFPGIFKAKDRSKYVRATPFAEAS